MRDWRSSSGSTSAQADALIDAGVTLADPARIDVRGALACGRDVTIDVGCVFEGTVHLADGVAIGAHCVLKNVTIEAGTQIEPFCHLDGATIGASCRIGPYARLRPGAALAEDVHIGNFVEVKASTIGRGPRPTTSPISATPRWAPASTSAPAPSPATTTASTSTAP